MKRAPWAVRSAFIANGLGVGAIYARIPDIKAIHNLSNANVGTVLLSASVGVLVAITFIGRVCAERGSKPVVIIASYIGSFTLFPVALAPNFVTLCLAFVIWGSVIASQDIAMNTHASTVEHETGKRYMSGFHAVFSLGALAGGLIGGIASQLNISLLTQSTFISILYITLATLVRSWWLPAETDIHEFKKEGKTKRPSIFLFIGLLGLASTINEGAAGDWGGILARDTFHAAPFLATLPYIFFNAAMVIGRFSGDRFATKFGALKILFSAGLFSGIGLAIGLAIGNIYGQIFGWFAIGAGMSVVIPMVFSLAAEIARERGVIAPSQAVAIASGISYFGFMAGPPTMGYISSIITLRWAMLIPAALAIFLAFGSRAIKHS
jgi:MFS family permease